VLTVGGLTYKIIPSRDFYKGIPNILNSEQAALVMVDKIYKSVPHGEEYFDPYFGPKDDKDINGSKFSLYYNGKGPNGYVQPE
jgi:hypothetical protein